MYWTVTPETPNRQFTGIVRHTMALIDKTNEGGLQIEFNMPHGAWSDRRSAVARRRSGDSHVVTVCDCVIHGRGGTHKSVRLSEKEKTILMSYHTDSSGNPSPLSSPTSSSTESEFRGYWVGRLDFILSCVGYAVGLGNIWRFPYLCYRNGGAVFLIPYLTFLVLCGMPLFFLEVAYGQFASLSPITVWRMSPFFKGIGYGMVIISAIVCIYYNMIIAWTLHYFFNSFLAVLPWSTCNNEWNTERCLDSSRRLALNMTNTTTTSPLVNSSLTWTTPSEEYWERGVLRISDGIDDMGSIRLDLLGCLALAWVVVFLCLIKGVQSSGRCEPDYVIYSDSRFHYFAASIVKMFLPLVVGVHLIHDAILL